MVALAVCGFPDDKLGKDVLARIFRGGRDKAAEAGCAIVGGHTILDAELKYGLCVLGSVEPAQRLTHTHAQPGDKLVLTKPLGFGIAAQALRKGLLAPDELALAVRHMTALNLAAKDAALAAGARAATDVTGFGLLGHLRHLLLGSGVAARVDASAVPLLPFVRRFAEQGLCPGGSRRNADYVAPHARFDPALAEADRLLLCDAQTSGGLLVAVPPAGEATLVAELARGGAAAQAVIGEVVEGEAGTMQVRA
jgi:selenide,water dikinase